MSIRLKHINALRAVARRLPADSVEQEALYSAADYLEAQESKNNMAKSVAALEPMIPAKTFHEAKAEIDLRLANLESRSLSLVDIERYVLVMIQEHARK